MAPLPLIGTPSNATTSAAMAALSAAKLVLLFATAATNYERLAAQHHRIGAPAVDAVSSPAPKFINVTSIDEHRLERRMIGGKPTCPVSNGAFYAGPDGSVYKLECYVDYSDQTVGLQYVHKWGDCMNVCSASSNCTAIAYEPSASTDPTSDGPCYLKSRAAEPANRNNKAIWGARQVTAGDDRFSWPSSIFPTSSFTSAAGFPTGAPADTIVVSNADGTVQTVTLPHGMVQGDTTSTKTKVVFVTPTSTTASTTSTTPSSTNTILSSIVPSSTTASTTSTTSSSTTTSTSTESESSSTSSTGSSDGTSTDSPSAPPNDGSNPWASCGILNHKSNTFWLRTHVIFGDSRFENLYVQNVAQDAPAQVPLLSANTDTRGQFYYDLSSSSIALWHGNCYFSGLSIDQDDAMDEWSPVFITASAGTPRMSITGSALTWRNDRFGSWLACERGDEVRLYYWDVSTAIGIDAESCAKVQLITEHV